jgi:hypothetical protein
MQAYCKMSSSIKNATIQTDLEAGCVYLPEPLPPFDERLGGSQGRRIVLPLTFSTDRPTSPPARSGLLCITAK